MSRVHVMVKEVWQPKEIGKARTSHSTASLICTSGHPAPAATLSRGWWTAVGKRRGPESRARAHRACWAIAWSYCAFGKDPFSQRMLTVPWKSMGGYNLFWCIYIRLYCRKDEDQKEHFFTFTHLNWGIWMPSLDFLISKQPQLTLSTGIIVSSHHF